MKVEGRQETGDGKPEIEVEQRVKERVALKKWR
jgi:hypothetical protein